MIDQRAILAELVLARGDIRAGRMREGQERMERVRAALPSLDAVQDPKLREMITDLCAALSKLDGVLHNIATNPYTPKQWRPSEN